MPLCGMPFVAEWPSGLGKGLQSPVHGFDSRLRLSVFLGARRFHQMPPPGEGEGDEPPPGPFGLQLTTVGSQL